MVEILLSNAIRVILSQFIKRSNAESLSVMFSTGFAGQIHLVFRFGFWEQYNSALPPDRLKTEATYKLSEQKSGFSIR